MSVEWKWLDHPKYWSGADALFIYMVKEATPGQWTVTRCPRGGPKPCEDLPTCFDSAAAGRAAADAAQRDYGAWVPDPTSLLPTSRD